MKVVAFVDHVHVVAVVMFVVDVFFHDSIDFFLDWNFCKK